MLSNEVIARQGCKMAPVFEKILIFFSANDDSGFNQGLLDG